MKKTFKVYWLDGKEEKIQGDNIADAFTRAGYGAGAIKALDYFEEVKGKEKKKCLEYYWMQ